MVSWLNGQLLQNPQLPAANAGSLLGWGVFTTLGIYHGKAVLPELHFQRLLRDATRLSIAPEHSASTVLAGLEAVIESNQVQHGLARFTLTACGDGRWLTAPGSHFLINAIAQSSPATSGLRLGVCPHRFCSDGPLAGAKLTSYAPYLQAWHQAKARGLDDCVLLTAEGWIAESARASLFWRSGEDWFTPSLKTGCLAGLGRQLVCHWLEAEGTPAHEGEYPLEMLLSAQEGVLMTAATGPRGVASLATPTANVEFSTAAGYEQLRSRWQQLLQA